MMREGLYVYYFRGEPRAAADLPEGGFICCTTYKERRYVKDIDCMTLGYVVYIRPLAPAEIAENELISAPREG